MALREKNRFKQLEGVSGGTLEADADESFRIRDIMCLPSGTDTYLTLQTQSMTVGMFRVAGKTGNHVPFRMVSTAQIYEALTGGLLNWLRTLGFDISYPVASGETFTVSRAADAGNVVLVYDVYDAGDVLPTEPNGSMSAVRRYLHYGENAANIETSPAAIDTSLIWSGGDGWPFDGGAVAEKNIFRLAAILASPGSRGTAAANAGYTTHLKLIHRNNVLFDEDGDGIPLLGDDSVIAATMDYVAIASAVGPLTAENPPPGLVFDPPMEFTEGDKLTTQMLVTDAGATGILATDLDVAFVLEHEYLP